jgi:hypothetical protein
VYKDLASKPHRKKHLEELGMDGRVTLKWILKKGITSITYLEEGKSKVVSANAMKAYEGVEV